MTPRLLPLLLMLLALPVEAATAQDEQPRAQLTLVTQTPVATPQQPLALSVRARHVGGRPLRNLTLSLWVYHPATSRSAYHEGLEGEPPTEPLLIAPFEKKGALREGQGRRLALQRRLPELEARGDNALYPIKVQLESGGVAVAAIRSMLVFVQDKPLVPLNASLTVVLDSEIRFSPDGALLDDSLEAAIAPGGRIDTVVSAFEAEPVRTTLVLSPLLLEWLDRMGDGYRVRQPEGERSVGAGSPPAQLAEGMLQRIRSLARSAATEVVALPYASPSVPSLVASGLEEDLRRQIAEGREVVETLTGAAVSPAIFRPPGSELDRESVAVLAETGVETVILDAGVVPPPLPGNSIYSALPTARLDHGVDAIVPDADLDSYLSADAVDPALQSIRVLGELAALYFEQPSVLRGVALVVGDRPVPDETLLRHVLRGMRMPPRAAWLRPVKASQLVQAVPSRTRARFVRGPGPPAFSPTFVDALWETREAIGQFESMTEEPTPLPDQLRTLLLAAEARRFATDEGDGLGFIREIREALAREFSKIEAPSGTAVTLTSQGGVIPVTLRSGAGYPVRVRVTLRSPRLNFLDGGSQEIVLDGEALALTFPVRAQTTGRFPVQILVDTPGGRRISESQIVVRSTAYNRVALLVTVGAALFLALWWGRRFLRPTTS